ncbi:alpha/beta hydrolase [Paucibacter sp. XJ19-41]|uniref:alpha/beta hydrolase n=1 Tax=Paucibacter sp. XJ19-41 TaxID=2927824 RepID=UPI002349B112|nr:alpha/beta fold hydrolase [Paucibacter sp. XJ19-41]MDC6169854.1 alpha/beta fold hydrolase [Paucibacter sp. XJ19-41]
MTIRSGWLIGGLIAAVPLALVLALLALLYLKQEALLFFPERLPPGHRFEMGADVHALEIELADGARLSVLQLRQAAPKGLVFYLHGNAGNLQSWFSRADFYRRAGFDLVMPDYRGYGLSSGRIGSEAQLHADVRAVWERLAPAYQGLPRVIVGRSLGTALAARLAAEVGAEQLVLISPYRHMAALMDEHYPLLPRWLLRYPLDTEAALADYAGPLLLIHGGRDTLIPPAHSQALQRAPRPADSPPARLWLLDEAGHNDLQAFDAYWQGLGEALSLAAAPAPARP